VAAPAWKSASEIAEGYLVLNAATLKRLLPAELASLQQELEKATRETRSLAVPPDDAEGAQKKSRRLLRLSQAVVVLQSYRSRGGRV
jgi:hypothetical protein